MSNLQQLKEEARKEFFDSIIYNESAEGCGLEDAGITNRYEAMGHGWNRALDAAEENIDSLITKALEEGKAIGREEKGKEKVDITDYIARLTDVVAESLKRLKVVEEGLVKHGILIPSK